MAPDDLRSYFILLNAPIRLSLIYWKGLMGTNSLGLICELQKNKYHKYGGRRFKSQGIFLPRLLSALCLRSRSSLVRSFWIGILNTSHDHSLAPKTLSTMTLSIMTCSITTLGIMAINTMLFWHFKHFSRSFFGPQNTHQNGMQYNDIEQNIQSHLLML